VSEKGKQRYQKMRKYYYRRHCKLWGKESTGVTYRACFESNARPPSRRESARRYLAKKRQLLSESKTLNTDNPLGN